jgi:hypothetical protein
VRVLDCQSELKRWLRWRPILDKTATHWWDHIDSARVTVYVLRWTAPDGTLIQAFTLGDEHVIAAGDFPNLVSAIRAGEHHGDQTCVEALERIWNRCAERAGLL